MSEDVIRPRPVVDTALPEELREDIYREANAPESHRMRTDGEAVSRALRLREGGVQLLGVGFTLGLALLTAGWYLGMVIASISLVAYVAALSLRKQADPVVRGVGAAVGGGALVAAPLWLFDVLPPDPPAGAPWLLFALLVGMVTADTLTARVKEPPEEHYRDRVLLPEDISAADHGLLVAVQQTIDKVTDARVELGGSGGSDTLDTARGLAVLREQEWRIASLLARQRELRREYIRRWQQASSPRVREVLEPQRRHLIAVEGHIRVRVDQIVEYGRLVEASVLAHREWEQCQEALDSMDAYTDLRAEASLMSVHSAEVAELADTAEVARRVRDESVTRVHAAVTGLMELPRE
ncbi:hypothetical protein [Nocardiopsis metallicus]|uniref:Uncharacterized protein n=1 Tax=Nocardiopsis metallicus TaxID=179819 RepID=A0A840WQF3_9ACTN|nr:hypothetical protein [Nocardiopsis metallicus]MBB5495221.1 hypothetical protein [Nocardiopsis metallicus]